VYSVKLYFHQKTKAMGLIYSEIELINGDDLALVRRHVIGEEEVRHITVKALVDTGAINLCINEDIQEIMQFPEIEIKTFQMATGELRKLQVVENVVLKFQNRRTNCTALVLPGSSEVLLGAIPMEDMDVWIDPRRQEMVVNPESPDVAVLSLKGVRPVKS
jgi:clan AA aspartic protease